MMNDKSSRRGFIAAAAGLVLGGGAVAYLNSEFQHEKAAPALRDLDILDPTSASILRHVFAQRPGAFTSSLCELSQEDVSRLTKYNGGSFLVNSPNTSAPRHIFKIQILQTGDKLFGGIYERGIAHSGFPSQDPEVKSSDCVGTFKEKGLDITADGINTAIDRFVKTNGPIKPKTGARLQNGQQAVP